jgi:hypothetical protein
VQCARTPRADQQRCPAPDQRDERDVCSLRQHAFQNFRDAEAIAEAVQRPTMKFVATKTADHSELQALHRVRERLTGEILPIIVGYSGG